MNRSRLLDAFFPRRCPICAEVTDPPDQEAGALQFIHPECYRKLTRAEGQICMKCGKLLSDSGKEYCDDCMKRMPAFDLGRSLFLNDKALAQSIYDYKYRNRREYADFYAAEMAVRYGRMIRSRHIDAIVPVPLHPKKLKRRGYNQTALVADRLSVLLGIPVSDCLVRAHETAAQKNLNRYARQRNLAEAFGFNEDCKPVDSVLLIDDIYTTGATMHTCSQVLKKAGVKQILCLTISIGME